MYVANEEELVAHFKQLIIERTMLVDLDADDLAWDLVNLVKAT